MPDTKTIHRRRSKLDPFIDRLGLIADTDIARLAGVTVKNVAAFRKRHGIELNPLPTVPAPVVTKTAPEVETEPGPELETVRRTLADWAECTGDWSEDEYRAETSLNFSTLKHLATSPRAFRYFADAPKSAPTAAQSLGTAIHMAVLEPERFAETYAVREKVDGRTKEGKAYNAQWEADNPGRVGVDRDTMNTIEAAVQAVNRDPSFQRLTDTDGAEVYRELPLFWEDPVFGSFKGRPDVLRWDGERLTVWDLKTTALRIDSHSVVRFIGEYLVSLQLMLYARGGLDKLGIPLEEAVNVEMKVTFVQTAAPFDAVTYRLSMSTKLTTADMLEELGALLADCTKRNVWRGLPSGNEIDVPPYYLTVK